MTDAIGHAMDAITQAGIAFALLLLMCFVLVKCVSVLYKRNQDLGDQILKAMVDQTTSNNNLSQQIERQNYVRKD